LCALALIAALLAPAVAATMIDRKARAELASIARQRAEASRVHENLRQVTAALAQVSGLTEGRRSMLELLAQLTAVLPEGSAITTLRVDSARGTLVVLTPRATEVVSQLDTVSLLVTPEIVGPVTRETNGGRELERVTLRFLLAANGSNADGRSRTMTKPPAVDVSVSAGPVGEPGRRVP
jgi:general secretion pathway protein L